MEYSIFVALLLITTANQICSSEYIIDDCMLKSDSYILQNSWMQLNNEVAVKQMADYFEVTIPETNDFNVINEIIVRAITKNTVDLHLIYDFFNIMQYTGLINYLRIKTVLILYSEIIQDESFSLMIQSDALNYLSDYLDLGDIHLPSDSLLLPYFKLLQDVMQATKSVEICRLKRELMTLDSEIKIHPKYRYLYNVIDHISENEVMVLKAYITRPVVKNEYIYYCEKDPQNPNRHICRASDASGYEIWNLELIGHGIEIAVDYSHVVYIVDKTTIIIINKNTGEIIGSYQSGIPIEYIRAAQSGGFFFVTSDDIYIGSATLYYLDENLNMFSKSVPKFKGMYKFKVMGDYCVATGASEHKFLVYDITLKSLEFTWDHTNDFLNTQYITIHDNILVYQNYDAQSKYVSCVDLSTKTVKFIIDNTHLIGDPILFDSKIYFRTRHNTQVLIEISTGQVIWSQKFSNSYGEIYSVLLISTKINVLNAYSGDFYQLSTETGEVIKTKWTISAGRAKELVGVLDDKVVLYSYHY